jgi:hypothetical protein
VLGLQACVTTCALKWPLAPLWEQNIGATLAVRRQEPRAQWMSVGLESWAFLRDAQRYRESLPWKVSPEELPSPLCTINTVRTLWGKVAQTCIVINQTQTTSMDTLVPTAPGFPGNPLCFLPEFLLFWSNLHFPKPDGFGYNWEIGVTVLETKQCCGTLPLRKAARACPLGSRDGETFFFFLGLMFELTVYFSTCKAVLLLEPHLQSILSWLFWRWVPLK